MTLPAPPSPTAGAARGSAAACGPSGHRVLLRALVVLGLLAALFAMHGATADHSMAMAAGQSHTSVTSAHPAGAALDHGEADPAAHTAASDSETSAAPSSSDSPMDMGQACVAVLAGAALALLLRLTWWASANDVPAAGRRRLRLARWGHAPPSPPDLAALCVLRI